MIRSKDASDEQIKNIEAFVDVFALALHIPHPELHLEKNVFVVHRHHSNALRVQSILGKHQVQAKVLKEELKNAAHILTALEDLLRECTAGFILATPDNDEAGVGQGKPVGQGRGKTSYRNRTVVCEIQNVDRVAILLKEPLILPSDLHGVYRPGQFAGSLGQIEDRIVAGP